MLSIQQARNQAGEAGQPLPMPVNGFRNEGVFIRKGGLTLCAAGPGQGKSALIHAMLYRGHDGEKAETLYFSADTGPAVIWDREAALATGKEQSEIKRLREAGALQHVEQQVAKGGQHIHWDFTGDLTPERIIMQINAYVELHDRYPDAVVIDNLKDFADQNDGDEWRALEDALVWAKNLAMSTGMAVIALHHVGGPGEDGIYPVPLSGLRGKVGKTPALVLTIHSPEPGEMRVSIVKHREGKKDTSGNYFVRIKADLGRMAFRG